MGYPFLAEQVVHVFTSSAISLVKVGQALEQGELVDLSLLLYLLAQVTIANLTLTARPLAQEGEAIQILDLEVVVGPRFLALLHYFLELGADP